MYRLAAIALLAAACGGPSKGAARAEALLSAGDYAEAQKLADSELARHPDDPALWRVKIRSAAARGDNRTAVSAYQAWLDRRNGNHDEDTLIKLAQSTIWQGLAVPSPQVQVAAVQAVERLEIEALALEVAKLMTSDHDAVAAAAAVAVLRSHPQAAEVAEQMRTSSDARARAIVIAGLGRKIGEPARTEITRALGDREVGVRRAAVGALARLSSEEDTDALIAIARADADGSVRARAMRALTRGDRREVLDVAARLLDDDFLGAQLAAVEYLEARGSDLGAGSLVRAAASGNVMVALRATVALAKLKRGIDRSIFERALADKAWTVRASAVNALARALPAKAARQLAGAALTDRRIQVRLAAARALLSLGAERLAMAELRYALKSPDRDARLQASADLARRGDIDGIKMLEAFATHQDPKLRAAAVPLQGSMPTLSRGLIQALADDSAGIRLQAAELVLRKLDN